MILNYVLLLEHQVHQVQFALIKIEKPEFGISYHQKYIPLLLFYSFFASICNLNFQPKLVLSFSELNGLPYSSGHVAKKTFSNTRPVLLDKAETMH